MTLDNCCGVELWNLMSLLFGVDLGADLYRLNGQGHRLQGGEYGHQL